MRIGELARRSRVATTALRYYEKAGLLPGSARTESGYRDYDRDTLPRLAFIRAAQAIGLSVAEIREVISIRDGGTPPCVHVLELIEQHRADVRARIRQLQQLERELALIAEQGRTVDPAECDPAGICKLIPTDASAVSPPVRRGRRGSSGPSARRVEAAPEQPPRHLRPSRTS
jgi:DNA-binding transcriptional MerR regulator